MTFGERMTLALFGVALVIAWTLLRGHKSGKLDLTEWLRGEDGRPSKSAPVMFGSFVLTSWVVMFQTLEKTLSDATFSAYLLVWVAPTLTAYFKRKPGGRADDKSEKPDAS